MQENIHPQYGPAQLQCACGNTFDTRSTKAVLKVEVCNQCHPFFTGKHRFVDKAGRIERFMRKYNKTAAPSTSQDEVQTDKAEEAPKATA